jgi:DNA-binding SARP family transcriptional activator/predicted ATPase
MARLTLSLLGSFEIELHGQPVTRSTKGKARALLAYLAVEADRAHRREALAALLWPDRPERSARANLRNTLSNLRKALSDADATADQAPTLLVTRETIQFNRAGDAWVDVTAFEERTTESIPALRRLEEAIALYRGPFLEGFAGGDSPLFDDWARSVRDRLAHQFSHALQVLALHHERRGELARACEIARRRVAHAPWQEEAHCTLMRLLAQSGQRGAALAQYESCRRALRAELDVEPGEETRRLYRAIQRGELARSRGMLDAGPVAPLPAFLTPHADLKRPPERPPFVARERELAQLDRFLELALAGQGRVAFITGEAGSGKTSLLQAFARLAQKRHAGLVVSSGTCNAYTGIGDPYLPFREILELLTGDVQARWAVGALDADHARRLWHALPLVAQALVESGPDLIDTFVPRAPLLERARTYAQWHGRADGLDRLETLAEHRSLTLTRSPDLQQSDLFEQYARVLQALARRRPLLLMIDDLQWADLGSTSLLFHLGRRLAGSHILIVGAYRPEDVALGRDAPLSTDRGARGGEGERHPLAPVIHEFQRTLGAISVNLGQAEGRDFVEALLESEPNRLGDAFREMLYRQTGGHPLFTIELLRGLQERGDVIQDAEGRWAEGPALDWTALPARVEAVIAERIGRLPEPLQAALRVASVEGEVFTAELVARVRATGEREMLERLSGELDRRHQLVRAQSIERIDGRLLSRYRFRHILFQSYLYGSLDKVERVHLHTQVGKVLEELYGASAESVQLARHFEEAKDAETAIHYLHQAGERAAQMFAYQEARTHLQRALALLATLSESTDRAKRELDLQLSLGWAWMAGESAVVEAGQAYARARDLCQQTGRTSDLPLVVGMLNTCAYVGAEHRRALELGREALALGRQAGDPLLVAVGHWRHTFVHFALGEYTTARAHLKAVIDYYEPRYHATLAPLCGSDPGPSALVYDACCLWCLGYPDQALHRAREALDLVRKLEHAVSLAEIRHFGCLLHAMRRDARALFESAEELMRLADRTHMRGWFGAGTFYRGEALAMQGQLQEGIAQMREGIAAYQSKGARTCVAGTLGALAEAQANAGRPKEGLATLDVALALMDETDERHWEAELSRLRGSLLLALGGEDCADASLRAETCFQTAIEVARRQRARSWELRATTSLSRLWQRQGKAAEACRALVEVYGWFTEGYGTADLREARALLEELAS